MIPKLKLTVEQKFTFVVNLARKHSVESLVLKIKQGNVIAKDSVLRESKRTLSNV